MIIKMIIAFVLAFLVTVGIGKVFVPWMKERSFTQPLKDEVAQMYNEREKEDQRET